MEITRESIDGVEMIRISGRLDGYWSTRLGQSLAGIIREGGRHLRLDFAEVAYLSSAGIGELVKAYQNLQAVEGSLVLLNPTKFVLQILDISKLTGMLMGDGLAPTPGEVERATDLEFDFGHFEVHELEAGATLECFVYGDEERLGKAGYQASDARRLPVPLQRFAVGIGALGETFEDCRTRFGEFVGVPGTVIYQPTDGTGTPDYLHASGRIAPDVMSLYGFYCDGGFARLARFEATHEAGDRVRCSQLAEACLDIAGASQVGVVMIAETTGLLGVALKQSPAAAGADFAHPGIREWISFHPERIHQGDLALIAGMVSRKPEPHLRPLGGEGGLYGHFHAAAFSYRPLRKGKLNLQSTIETLLESSQLHGVLHLISDTREIAGLGESEFVRGACWVSPIQ